METKKWFINPYTFVPFRKTAPERKPAREWRGPLTGSIDCQIEIKTPLAIPDTQHRKKDPLVQDHYQYPFMRRNPEDDGTAYIPGSEIRGMIRSVYEAATDSCLSILEDSQLTARSKSFTQQAGVIKKEQDGKWYLYETDYAILDTLSSHAVYQQGKDADGVYLKKAGEDHLYRHGEKVTFSFYKDRFKRNVAQQLNAGNRTGYLLIAERGLNDFGLKGHKHSHIMFAPDRGSIKIPIGSQAENLMEVLDKYQDTKTNQIYGTKKHHGYAGYRVSQTDYTPVFFQKIKDESGRNSVYLLSPAMQGREVLGRSLIDGFAGGYNPCWKTGKKSEHPENEPLCAACALFGQVGATGSMAGRIRFLDAEAVGTIQFKKHVTLKELGSPKVTSTEFYTEIDREGKNRPEEWNYLYKAVGTDKTTRRRVLLKGNELHLRGRKFYLHHRNPEYQTTEKTNRNSTMELATGGTFRFRVAFDHLTEQELQMLVWCLSPWRKKEDGCEELYHKLGHGRPLGLGSVRISLVSDPVLRVISLSDSGKLNYRMEKHTGDSGVAEEAVPNALKNVLAFGLQQVTYPVVSINGPARNANEGAGHQWFNQNKQEGIGGSGTRHAIKYVLPYLPLEEKSTEELEKNLRLPELSTGKPDDADRGRLSPVVDAKYQKPQQKIWLGEMFSIAPGGAAGGQPQSSGASAAASGDGAVVKYRPGQTLTVTIREIVAPKNISAHCVMPDGQAGYLQTFNDLTKKYKPGDKVGVSVVKEDTERKNWKLRLA